MLAHTSKKLSGPSLSNAPHHAETMAEDKGTGAQLLILVLQKPQNPNYKINY